MGRVYKRNLSWCQLEAYKVTGSEVFGLSIHYRDRTGHVTVVHTTLSPALARAIIRKLRGALHGKDT